MINLKRSGILSTIAIAILLSGCANDFSGNKYGSVGMGQVNKVQFGQVVSMRSIKIKLSGEDKGSGGMVAGAAGGALLGSAFGKGHGKIASSVGGGIIGGAIGNLIQNRDKDGFEYTVRLDNGSTIAIAQGVEPKISVGQRVQIIKAEKGVNSDRGRSRIIPAA